MEKEAGATPESIKSPDSETPNVRVMQFVVGELADGRTAGVLVDKASIPDGGDPFCFTEKFPATVLPQRQTLFDRGKEMVKNWLFSEKVTRYRVIPHS